MLRPSSDGRQAWPICTPMKSHVLEPTLLETGNVPNGVAAFTPGQQIEGCPRQRKITSAGWNKKCQEAAEDRGSTRGLKRVVLRERLNGGPKEIEDGGRDFRRMSLTGLCGGNGVRLDTVIPVQRHRIKHCSDRQTMPNFMPRNSADAMH